jgi:predicted nucleotidyltransferase
MSEQIDLSGTKLGTEEKTAISAFCEALHNAPSVIIQSITLYGSAVREDYRPSKSDINLLVVIEEINVPILNSVLDPVARGRRYGITPFFITESNLRSSADVFPVKFLHMKESYKVLYGTDILSELEISHNNLRMRCEQEIKNLLLRLRRQYIMGGGQRISNMMSMTIAGFLETLRATISLAQVELPSREDIVDVAARTFELDAEILQKVISLRDLDTELPREEAEQLFDKFMAIVEKVAQIVDQMEL